MSSKKLCPIFRILAHSTLHALCYYTLSLLICFNFWNPYLVLSLSLSHLSIGRLFHCSFAFFYSFSLSCAWGLSFKPKLFIIPNFKPFYPFKILTPQFSFPCTQFLFSHFFAILSSILIGLFTLNTIFMVYLLGFSILLAEFQFKKYFSPPPHSHLPKGAW